VSITAWFRGAVMANKRQICYDNPVALRSCLVSCLDLSGNEHAVEVTADTLYEAVGKALCLLRQDDWVEEIGNGLTEVKVRVRQPAVEHRILVKDFRKWMEARGRTPAECALKLKLAEMVRDRGRK
jgi:hypothetical protein